MRKFLVVAGILLAFSFGYQYFFGGIDPTQPTGVQTTPSGSYTNGGQVQFGGSTSGHCTEDGDPVNRYPSGDYNAYEQSPSDYTSGRVDTVRPC